MNKEQQELLDEVYDNYTQTKIVKNDDGTETHTSPIGHYNGMTKEEFINKCKTDTEFSKHWGLTIEEIAISDEGRYHIWFNNNYESGMERYFDANNLPKFDNPYYEPTPTKIITMTYNNKTIISYE
jgi:hypothetical protein